MALTYSDLNRLQAEFLAASDSDERADSELLQEARLGARAMRDAMVAQLAAKMGSRLHHSFGNELVRQIARGALILSLERRHDARELLTFAGQLVQRASHASPTPMSLNLPETTASKAREYFETYLDHPERVERLAAAAHDFVVENDTLSGGVMFARFLSDLEFLRTVALSTKWTDASRRIAAGALTYFVQTHDAIADDLGIVGLMDDAYIAQFASEQLDPLRATKTRFVDALLADWPFLSRLRLSARGEAGARSDWSPTEFVLANVAATYGKDAGARTAIVLPKVGTLPHCLGLLGALGILQEAATGAAVLFRPAVGEFVALAGREDEAIEISGYFQPPGGRHDEVASPESATMVQLRYAPRSKKKGGRDVKHLRRVEFLDGCVSASERGGRPTLLPRSHGDVDLGPLERLFGLSQPLRLDAIRQRVILVAPLGVAKAALEGNELFGTPIVDVIPCGRTLPEDRYDVEWWSSRTTGALPLLTVARDLAEAAAIAHRFRDLELSVVTGIDRVEWDAGSFAQLEVAKLVAILPQWQSDAQTWLGKKGFRVLDWTRELEGKVARCSSLSTSEMDRYERDVRRQLVADVTVHDVELDGIELGLRTLKDLSSTIHHDYGEEVPGEISTWVSRAQQLFFDLNGSPLRIGETDAPRFESAFGELDLLLDRTKRLWSASGAGRASAQLNALRHLFGELRRRNPKEQALADLFQGRELAVRCESRHWSALRSKFPTAVWLDERSLRRSVLVFKWPGTVRAERMLLPPIGDPTHFVLYRWERNALERVRLGRANRLATHWTPERRPKHWGGEEEHPSRTPMPASASPPPTEVAADRSPTVDLEGWLAAMRRRSVVTAAGSVDADDPMVEALPVYFVGNQFALYTPTFNIHVATNVNVLSRTTDQRLQEKAPHSLLPGDVVLVRSGAERDAIRQRADSRLPPGSRELARTWHGSLQRLRNRLASDRAVHRALAAAGCKKTEATINGWLRSQEQIGPHDDRDVDFICAATSDPSLVGRLEDCKAAIHLVRSEHLRASHELFVRALEEVNTRLKLGKSLDEAIDLGDQLQLLIVEHVDERLVSVARSATNSPGGLP